MTNLSSQKKMAAVIMKCGKSRVRIEPSSEVEDALTREDIRILIRKGLIKKVQKKGSSRAAARKILAQKKRGRRKGMGSRKGSMGARAPKKKRWMKTVKTLRATIRELRDSGRIERSEYRKLYRRVKGGMFRNKKHIMLYIKEHELLKEAARPKPKPKKAAKKPAKKTVAKTNAAAPKKAKKSKK